MTATGELFKFGLTDEYLAGAVFKPLRDGVDIHVLHDGPEGSRAALLRYGAGAMIPAHRHEGHEYIYVLRGSQSDERRGTYGAGTFIVNEPGTTHRVSSETGCLILIIWERPVSFL